MKIRDRAFEADTISGPRSAGQLAGYETIKPTVDFTLALVMLLSSIPVLVFAMILVRLSSRGPSIYRQKRLGQGGKVFTIYKVRTMYQDSERHSGPTWSIPGDPRVTPVGRILRWSHLDELPQLINVLNGEMSLIGPRPERPEIAARLDLELASYHLRLAVRPGLTGLAQVRQAPDTDTSSVRRKLNYDLYYVERMSPWLDFRLLLATTLKCLGVPFAAIGWILQLPEPNAHLASELLTPSTDLTNKTLVPESYLA